MNKFGIIVIIAVTLFLGYSIGKQSDKYPASSYQPSSGLSAYSLPSTHPESSGSEYNQPNTASSIDNEQELSNLKSKLDDARYSAESARSAAQEVEHQSTMRYIETGSLEDQMKMHDAQNAVGETENTLNTLNAP